MFSVFKKILIFFGILFCLFINSSKVWSNSNVGLVEIKLLDNLDDKRGFCIDVKGHKFKAKIKRGIQVHTCYSYQGKIAVDQGLDAKKLKQRQLFFPNFDVCVHPSSYINPLCRKVKRQNSKSFPAVQISSKTTLSQNGASLGITSPGMLDDRRNRFLMTTEIAFLLSFSSSLSRSFTISSPSRKEYGRGNRF